MLDGTVRRTPAKPSSQIEGRYYTPPHLLDLYPGVETTFWRACRPCASTGPASGRRSWWKERRREASRSLASRVAACGNGERAGWADVSLWLLLVVIVVGLFLAAWWPGRQGNGE
jgi:hypothetical protein